ncbi:MAG: hypothetical protein WCN98_02670 [Verrucomicrobiaceae bacterium]
MSGEDIIDPPEWARQLAEGGVVFEVKDHARRAYPKLYCGKSSPFRGDVWDRPNWPLPSSSGHLGAVSGMDTYRDLHPTVRIAGMTKIDYLLAGAAQKLATAWVCTRFCPDPRAWIEESLGPLAAISIGEQLENSFDRVLSRGIVLDPSSKKGQWRWWAAMTGLSDEACRKAFDRNHGLRRRWQLAWDVGGGRPWRVRLNDARVWSVVLIPAWTESEAQELLGVEEAAVSGATVGCCDRMNISEGRLGRAIYTGLHRPNCESPNSYWLNPRNPQ